MHKNTIEFELRVKFPRELALETVAQQLQSNIKLHQVSEIDVVDMQARSTNKSQQVASIVVSLKLKQLLSEAEKSACINEFCQLALQTEVSEVFPANQLAAA